MITVIQSDRDAAAAYHRTIRGRRILADNIQAGYVDDDALVQAFARYRLALTGAA
jgi:hypothetical protein